jgi:hypothetical protein
MTKDSRVNAPAGQHSTAAESRRSDLDQKGSIGALENEFCEERVEGKSRQTRIIKSNRHPGLIIAAVSIPVAETITRLVKPDDSRTQLNA